MPSKSAKQHRFMEGIAHGMKPKKKGAPSVAVAKDFVDADKGKKFDGVVKGCSPKGGGCTCGQLGK